MSEQRYDAQKPSVAKILISYLLYTKTLTERKIESSLIDIRPILLGNYSEEETDQMLSEAMEAFFVFDEEDSETVEATAKLASATKDFMENAGDNAFRKELVKAFEEHDQAVNNFYEGENRRHYEQNTARVKELKDKVRKEAQSTSSLDLEVLK